MSWWQQGVSRVGNKGKKNKAVEMEWTDDDFKGRKPEEINLGSGISYDWSIRGVGWWNPL